MKNKKRTPLIMPAVLAGALLACTAGCHSSDTAAPLPVPAQAQPPQSQADAIQKIQNNPNIPAGQKATIISQMQAGNHTPASGGSAHP